MQNNCSTLSCFSKTSPSAAAEILPLSETGLLPQPKYPQLIFIGTTSYSYTLGAHIGQALSVFIGTGKGWCFASSQFYLDPCCLDLKAWQLSQLLEEDSQLKLDCMRLLWAALWTWHLLEKPAYSAVSCHCRYLKEQPCAPQCLLQSGSSPGDSQEA